jgi:hypothetical protein
MDENSFRVTWIDLAKACGLLAMMAFCFITACALVYVIK